MTTKYSGGYLQRKKMFSSKKENKDEMNIMRVGPEGQLGKGDKTGGLRVVDTNGVGKGKPKYEEKDRGMKK